jgi:hypothetical protein
MSKVSETITQTPKGLGNVHQVVEHLSNKHEALGSIQHQNKEEKRESKLNHRATASKKFLL